MAERLRGQKLLRSSREMEIMSKVEILKISDWVITVSAVMEMSINTVGLELGLRVFGAEEGGGKDSR